MAIPETIRKLANDIRTKIFGREVREALAQGIEEAGNIADQANQTSSAAVEQVRNIQAQVDQLVAEGDSSVEAAQARVDADGNVFKTLKERLDTKDREFTAQLAQKADQYYVDTQLANVVDGSPKGVYATLTDLQNAYPNGATGIYVVTENGNWYYWNGSVWTSGGKYQSTGIADKSITPKTLSDNVIEVIEEPQLKVEYGVNLFNPESAIPNTILLESLKGEIGEESGWSTSDFIPVEPDKEISVVPARRIAEYDKFKQYIPGTFKDIPDTSSQTFITNKKTKYIRISLLTTSLSVGQVKYGSSTLRRYPYTGKHILKPKNGSEVYVDHVINHKYAIKSGGKNLYDRELAEKDTRLANNGTTIMALGWETSGFIEVPQGNITISSVRYIHQYDKYYEPIVDSFVDLGMQTGHTFKVDEKAKYIRFTYYSSTQNVQVEVGNEVTDYEPHYYSAYVDGKKVHDFREGMELDELNSRISIIEETVNVDETKIDHTKVNLKQIDVISPFSLDEWIKVAGEGTVDEDATNVKFGTESIKISATSDQYATIEKSVDISLKNGEIIVFRLYIPNKNAISFLQIFFGDATFSDYYAWYYPVSRLRDGWNTITEPVLALSKKSASTPETLLNSIKTIRIYTRAATGYDLYVTFDLIGKAKSAIRKGKVCIMFDDGEISVWQYAKPILDRYGFRAVVPVIRDLIGHSNFMTMEQLRTLYENGWDITTHGQRDLTTLTREGIVADLEYNKEILMENGFTRSAVHFVSHQGKYNDIALEEIKKRFITHRTTEFRYVTLPVDDRYRLGNVSGNNSPIEQLRAYVDYAAKNKVVAMINWHALVESDATGNQGLVSVFEEFVEYLANSNVDVVTISDIFNPTD